MTDGINLKKIGVITFSLSNNGAERVFAELSNEWARQGHEVTVIQFEDNAYGSESYQLDPLVQKITLSRRNIKNKIIRYLAYTYDIRRWLKTNKKVVVIAFSFTTQVTTAIASTFLRNKIIFSERNDPNNCPYSEISRTIRNLVFYRAEKIVFQTEDAKAYFRKTIQRKGTIIVNPINPDLPKQFLGERRKVVITAARLRPQKNLELLIDAFADFHEQYKDYNLEIFGIGEELDSLKRRAIEKKIAESVLFMGFAKDVNDKMRDASMYVCSSDYEGISNSMIEAVGMGVPTISTDCPIGGARAIIHDGVNGLLVPVKSKEKMVEAMVHVAKDKAFAEYISKNGCELRKKLSVEKIASMWIVLMDK